MIGGARRWLAGALVVTACLTGCRGAADQPAVAPAPSPRTTVSPPPPTSPEPTASPRRSPVARDDVPPAAPRRESRPRAATTVVTRVVDGDTVEAGGRTVRLIGVDTPEEDVCGFARTSRAMSGLVLGERVRLTRVPGRDDRDRYGRLLRYVDVRGIDAGLAMIRRGLADARYDSRDGYGAHPRQARYVRADARHRDIRCPGQPAAAPVAPVAPGLGGCDPSYPGVCVPGYPPDLDCRDVSVSRFRVSGADPHRFDSDGDGVACEG